MSVIRYTVESMSKPAFRLVSFVYARLGLAITVLLAIFYLCIGSFKDIVDTNFDTMTSATAGSLILAVWWSGCRDPCPEVYAIVMVLAVIATLGLALNVKTVYSLAWHAIRCERKLHPGVGTMFHNISPKCIVDVLSFAGAADPSPSQIKQTVRPTTQSYELA